MNIGFNPEAYAFAGCLYHYGYGEEADEIAEWILGDVAETFGRYDDAMLFGPDEALKLADPEGRYATKGTCDHCGAHFNFGAVFKHRETNAHLIVGHICAVNKLALSGGEYADALLRRTVKAARTKAKMRLVRAKNRARLESGELGPELTEALNYPHPFCESIRSNFIDGHVMTDKMKSAVKRAVSEDWSRTNAPPEPDPVPIPDLPKRATFSGEILGLKEVESMYGVTTKMVFRDERGFKLFGTVPSALYDSDDPLKGANVTFDAAVEISKDDPAFGFFKRPTKAARLVA